MDDCEDLTKHQIKKHHKHKKTRHDRDDLGGMMLNMGGHIDPREIFIIWIIFIFLHTEMFAEVFLSRFQGTTNEDHTLTMKGTFATSIILILVVMICSMVF